MLKTTHPPVLIAGPDKVSSQILFSWLLVLRWGAVISQVILIAAVAVFFRIDIPVTFLSGLILFEAASNFYFSYLKKRRHYIPEWLFGLVMFLDTALFTLLLFYTGGPMNPFTFLYLVHVTLGAILMRPKWAWSLATLTIICYASLFILSPDFIERNLVQGLSGPEQTLCLSVVNASSVLEAHMKIHLQGMWLAFAITTFFIVFFVGRIQRSLIEHQNALADLETIKIRNEKLASLATLAAGAAHEFSTPLSTIAVASGEMLHHLKEHNGPTELVEDTKLIRSQVYRCKEILYQMAADAGEHLGEAVQEFTIKELHALVMRTFSTADQEKIDFTDNTTNLILQMPLRTLTRIIRGLIKNSLDACHENKMITFECEKDETYLYFRVIDQGVGMDEETLAKATEPFFTSKEPGKGLGLGLFLAKSAAERFNGYININSEPGKGTIVTLALKLNNILKNEG